MRLTQAHVRGICATALKYLDDDQAPAAARHLHRAVDTAINRRHPDADRRARRALRHMTLDSLPDWTDAATRADLVSQLREVARCGLDLTEMVGQPHANVAGRIWFHGAYSSRRVIADRPRPAGLSYEGRPWLYLLTDDEQARNPVVLAAEFAA
ncbi:hypothetical protein [Streptomyces sp. Root369]|uniref:hypothetical protein n=1 Tax=Streptomyces sp. Root369 TaxID=1736523 RepID=UPI00070C4C3C|nr:hypothetical protein [Streptomyces sp. Root369]KQW13551.1 hypothetical protein ASD08_30775 [Streptomyces sp. Root369]